MPAKPYGPCDTCGTTEDVRVFVVYLYPHGIDLCPECVELTVGAMPV